MPYRYRVGLTGGIGSGKSTVADLFATLGVPVLDADRISHGLTSPGSPVNQRIAELFGSHLIDDQGRLDRKGLGEIVFNDAASRARLEAVLHPLVYATLQQNVAEQDAPYCLLSIPLLFESGGRDQVDTVLVVDCPVSLQIERVCLRDRVDAARVQRIIDAQIPRGERLKMADDIIENSGDTAHLEQQVRQLHSVYQSRAASRGRTG